MPRLLETEGPHSTILRAFGLKLDDVRAYARTYGSPSDLHSAARNLTDRLMSMEEPPIVGHQIEQAMREQQITRRDAAQYVFTQSFGEPLNP